MNSRSWWGRLRARARRLWNRLLWWWHSRRLTYRVRAWAGDRYGSVQPLMTKPESFETFVRTGHMELEVQACGTYTGTGAAPAIQKLWDEGLLYGSDPAVQYWLEDGTSTRDPGDISPADAIEEMELENTIRVPPSFLEDIGPQR